MCGRRVRELDGGGSHAESEQASRRAALTVTESPVVSLAPRVQPTLAVDGEAVSGARGDIDDVAERRDPVRPQLHHRVAVAKPAVRAGAP